MSTEDVSQLSDEDKALVALLRDAFGDPYPGVGYSEACDRFESLAIENAQLRAALESERIDHANQGIVLGEVYSERDNLTGLLEMTESQRDRATKMLNEANARITALIDAADRAEEQLASVDHQLSRAPSSRPPKP